MDKALLNLGASINLMPLAIQKRIGDFEVKPTIKYRYGVVEDVFVHVDKFIFPVDFVVMDIEKHNEVPFILVRPFMKRLELLLVLMRKNLK